MDYQARSGDIGFVMHHGNWLSRVIAWFMGSRWSHSFLVVGELHGKPLVCETSDLEVMFAPLDAYLDDPNCSVEILRPTGLTDSQLAEITHKVFPIIKQGYGFFQLFSLGARRLFKRVGVEIPNFIRQGIVCCAVPVTGYRGGPIRLLDIDPESIDTQDLYEIVLQAEFKVVLEKGMRP